MDSYCIILLRSYNYDTQATHDSNKEYNVNNLILPIKFNPISYIGSNQNLFAKSTRISTVFSWIQPVKSC